MRVALIVPGGVDRSGTRRVMPFLVALVERLARRHDVQVIALFQESEPTTYPLRGATVHNIGRGRTPWRALHRLYALHRARPFDVLHAVWASPSGTLGAIARRLLRRPLVVHLLGGELVALPDIDYGEMRTLQGRLRVRVALNGATRITAQSEPICVLARSAGYAAERLPLGIDLDAWPPRPPIARARDRAARLVHVASINAVKDPFTLVRAAALLVDAGVDFTLDVVGEDTLGGRVQALTDEAGLAPRVRFHGFLEQQALRPLMERADLLVMSSRHEAGPAVLLEAGIVGVPTVGTAVGHIREWSPDAALAVPVLDAAALANGVRALLDDETRRLRMARLAFARATTEHADWTATRIENVYHELCRA